MKRPYRIFLAFMALLLCLGSPGVLVQAVVRAEPTAANQYSISMPGIAPANIDMSGTVQVPYNTGLNYAGSSISIEGWVKRGNTNRYETLIGNGINSYWWFGFSPSGKLRFTSAGTAYLVDSLGSVPAGVWTHVAVTMSINGVRTFFINGAVDSVISTYTPTISDNPAHPALEIGHDRDNLAGVNYFAGSIEDLRLWRGARTPAQIQAGMWAKAGAGASGLQAEWPFNGDANDVLGNSNGVLKGNGWSFTADGAIPHDITVPQVASAMTLDGVCAPSEYPSSILLNVGPATAYLQHTSTDLWVCLDGVLPADTSAQVFLDPDFTRQDPATPDHVRLSIAYPATLSTSVGDANGGWSAAPFLDSRWSAATYSTGGDFPHRSTEFRVNTLLLGAWSHPVGLAMATNLAPTVWPALSNALNPSTWSAAMLAGTGLTRSFNGSVIFVPKASGAATSPVGGIKLNLVGYETNGTEALVGSVTTGANGAFALTSTDSFSRHRLEALNPPVGMNYLDAIPGASGVKLDKRTIDYAAAGAGNYSGSTFKLGDARPDPLDTDAGPIYLIAAKQSVIDAGALTTFVDYKQRLGFDVILKSLEWITATYPGVNQAQKIRNYEKALHTLFGTRFEYVLLVGSTDITVPPVKIYPYLDGSSGNTCGAPKAAFKYSDWYFVDLVSNFDSNGDGCWADGIWASPALGFTPDHNIHFEHDISLGRIPFDDSNKIRNVLANSIGFERQSQTYKMSALAAMSQLAMVGNDDYGNPCTDWPGTHCAPPNSGNYDMALLGQVLNFADFLPLGYTLKGYYENMPAKAGGSGILANQLDPAAIKTDLGSNHYGFVTFDGHGNGSGVYRVYWAGDFNHDGQPNIAEMGGGDLFTTSELNGLAQAKSQGGVYYTMACGAADPTQADNFTYTLVGDAHAVAAIGAYNIITVAPWSGPSYTGMGQDTLVDVANAIFQNNARLGDALWGMQSFEITFVPPSSSAPGSGLVGMGLFGDPALSYQGGVSAGANNASWSMLRREPSGQAYFPLPGPTLPKNIWNFNAPGPAAPVTNRPSPVANGNGEVIVPSGSSLKVLNNGALYQTLSLTNNAYGSPALSADGTLYAIDSGGILYSFPYSSSGSNHNRSKRWSIQLGGNPITGVTLGSDGSVLVGLSYPLPGFSTIAIVRPDGHIKYVNVQGTIQAAVTTGANRGIFVATRDFTTGFGFLYRDSSDCFLSNGCFSRSYSQVSAFTTAPLLANNYIYVGDVSGHVLRFDQRTLNLVSSTATGSQIVAGPVIGPGGQILVGLLNGSVVSLNSDLSPHWTRSLGALPISSVPAFSEDGLYVTSSDFLYALSPVSGAILWKHSLAGAGDGSVAVDFSRQIYLLTSSGKLMAFGEGWVPPITDFQAIAGKVELTPAMLLSWSLGLSLAAPNSAQDAATSTAGLLLQRSQDGSDWQTIAYLPPTATSYNDLSAVTGVSYLYRIQVLDTTGASSDYAGNSDPAQSLPAAPTAPTLDSVVALSDSAIQISWTPPAGSAVNGYRIDTSDLPGGPFSVLTWLSGEAASYTVTGLTSGSTHYYRVSAYNQNFPGPVSATLGATTFTQNLPAPATLSAALVNNAEIDLSWSGRPAGALAQIEFRPQGASDFVPLDTVDADAYTFFPGDPNGYIFRVRFVQGQQDSPYTVSNSVKIIPTYRMFIPLTAR